MFRFDHFLIVGFLRWVFLPPHYQTHMIRFIGAQTANDNFIFHIMLFFNPIFGGVCVDSGTSGFLPQNRNTTVRLTGLSYLLLWVCVFIVVLWWDYRTAHNVPFLSPKECWRLVGWKFNENWIKLLLKLKLQQKQ